MIVLCANIFWGVAEIAAFEAMKGSKSKFNVFAENLIQFNLDTWTV